MRSTKPKTKVVIDAAALRRRRFFAGLSQTELATLAAPSSYQHISDLERGRGNASPGLLARLAKALDCTPADLVTEVEV